MPASKTLIVDTGASGHYFPLSHLSLLYDIASISDPADTQIQLPNGTLMSPSHSGFLRSDVPLPKAALKVFVFPELQHALLSIALLCEHKCTAAFTNRAVHIYLNDNLIFTGFRNVDHTADPLRDLWTLVFPVAPCLPDASQNARLPIASCGSGYKTVKQLGASSIQRRASRILSCSYGITSDPNLYDSRSEWLDTTSGSHR